MSIAPASGFMNLSQDGTSRGEKQVLIDPRAISPAGQTALMEGWNVRKNAIIEMGLYCMKYSSIFLRILYEQLIGS